MPALPSSIMEPLWVQVAALLPARRFPTRQGCHRPRIPDRIVFDKLIQILVFGCGYRRIAGANRPAVQPPPLRHRTARWSFAVRLREQVDLDALRAELLAAVEQTMQPTQASLWLRPPAGAPQPS